MSGLSQWFLLFRVHLRILRSKAVSVANHSRLLACTIALFLAGYSAASYLLFQRALEYVYRLPGAGSLLSDRLIHLIFFCFALMLAFSVAVTGYIALYRNRDTRWLLTLPVSHRVIFAWKCFEAAMFSSWGLVFILAPLLAAFARTREAAPAFYLKTALALAPFLVIASALGAIVLVTAVRWLSRRQVAIAAALVLIFVLGSAAATALQDRDLVERPGLSAGITFQRVLRHTQLTVNPFVPSAWLAGSIVDWSRPFAAGGSLLQPALLLSHGLAAICLLGWAGGRWFYPSWNRSLQHSASHALRRSRRAATDGEFRGSGNSAPSGGTIPGEKAGRSRRGIVPGLSGKKRRARAYPPPSRLRHLTGRPLAAVARKDFLTFVREPAQWVQFSVIFGLLALYAGGLRQMNSSLDQPRDLYLTAFLNLAVCALALSTLTTRFVFPQFSLEGRRLWILAMSPLKLPGIVLQKFFTSTLASGALVVAILLLSGYNLRLPVADSLFFGLAIALLAIGLNALATGLGVLFPNLDEANAAKIVSGFGGTLCLVASFAYIVIFVLLLAGARVEIFQKNEIQPGWWRENEALWCLAAAIALSMVVTLTPLFFSRNRLKKLEILNNL